MPEPDWFDALLTHVASHPRATIQDWIKFVFQATFGGGHLLDDAAEVASRIRAEVRSLRDSTEKEPGRILCEPLGEGLCRLDVVAAEAAGVGAEAIARVFSATAQSSPDSVPIYIRRLQRLREACRSGELAGPVAEVESYIDAQAAQGYPAVGHSAIYREVYRPGYRIMRQAHLPYLQVVQAIERRLPATSIGGPPLVMAIEGPCGSGKSTLAGALQELYGGAAAVIHMDDFFLPPELQTAARLAEPGGNIHYERFRDEVAAALRAGGAFSHRVYDCTTRAYAEKPVRIVPDRLVIVEGVYGMHPRIGIDYDLAVFVSISRTEQARRVRQRSGERLWQRFESEWIPMENRYFEAFAVRARCDLTIGESYEPEAPPSVSS